MALIASTVDLPLSQVASYRLHLVTKVTAAPRTWPINCAEPLESFRFALARLEIVERANFVALSIVLVAALGSEPCPIG